jgi:hypothetical protein
LLAAALLDDLFQQLAIGANGSYCFLLWASFMITAHSNAVTG